MILVPFMAQGFLYFTGGFHMIRRAMETEEVFDRIQTILKTKVKPPDIFDPVGLPTKSTE